MATPALPAVLSAQSMMGTGVRDPASPVRLENPQFFKAHFRWQFLPEPSLIQAARANSPTSLNCAHPCPPGHNPRLTQSVGLRRSPGAQTNTGRAGKAG